MRAFHLSKVVFGFLLAFQTSIANDEAPSVAVSGSVNSCGPVPLDIKGGTPPYTITIKKAVSAWLQDQFIVKERDVRESLADRSIALFSLPAGMTNGMVITFEVKDSKGLTTTSGQSTVSPSTDCPQPPQGPAGKPDGAADAKSPGDVAPPGPPGGDGGAKNPTDGSAPASPENPPGGSTPAPAPSPNPNPAPPAPGQPANALNATGNSTATGPQPGDPPSSNTTNISGSINANMTDKAGSGVNATMSDNSASNNSTGKAGSTNSTTITPPRPNYTPPKNNGNSSSSVNNRPTPPRSGASRGQLNSFYLHLFVVCLTGLIISR
ncbi:hypothetical protein PGTUg99_036365 [Puccinia graminis f. sp. tritici]|uniref:Uncharacterized protein n=1 Tax=Puccinia graminis f. sp. tritici TaxID=56615 RepID=A0A5B0RN86_PUCGR|nr:hypothetical protein PGTUg99_036365 [Puccinia graminis f. sp. tritici]